MNDKIVDKIIPMLEANADYTLSCKPRLRVAFTSSHSGKIDKREEDFYLGYQIAMQDAVKYIKALIRYEFKEKK
jgi:hypothetical protein